MSKEDGFDQIILPRPFNGQWTKVFWLNLHILIADEFKINSLELESAPRMFINWIKNFLSATPLMQFQFANISSLSNCHAPLMHFWIQ